MTMKSIILAGIFLSITTYQAQANTDKCNHYRDYARSVLKSRLVGLPLVNSQSTNTELNKIAQAAYTIEVGNTTISKKQIIDSFQTKIYIKCELEEINQPKKTTFPGRLGY